MGIVGWVQITGRAQQRPEAHELYDMAGLSEFSFMIWNAGTVPCRRADGDWYGAWPI